MHLTIHTKSTILFFSHTLKEDSLIQSFKLELTPTPLGKKTYLTEIEGEKMGTINYKIDASEATEWATISC